MLRKPSLIGILLVLVALVPRLAIVLHPAPPVLYLDTWVHGYNTDEMHVVASLLDRFLGVPSVCAMWPVTTLQIAAFPVWLIGALLHGGVPHGVNGMMSHLGAALAVGLGKPAGVLTLLRAVNVVLTSFVTPMVYGLARRMGASRMFGVLAALAILLNPQFFQQSIMASGEALLVTFILLGLYLGSMLDTSPQRHDLLLLGIGFCYAAAIASKYTAVPLGILFVLFLYAHGSWALTVRRFVGFAIGAFLGVYALIPWVWTDPIRVAKGVAGNVSKQGTVASFRVWVELHLSAYGLPECLLLVALLLTGLFALITARGRVRFWLLVSFAGVFGVSWPVYRAATSAFPRYLIPELVTFLFVALGIAQWSQTRLSERQRRVLGVAMVVCLLGTSWVVIEKVRYFRTDDGFEEALAMRDQMSAGSMLWLPDRVLTFDSGILDAEYWQQAEKASDRLYHENRGLEDWLGSHSLPPSTADPLLLDFSEYEQSQAAHIRVQKQFAKQQRWHMQVYRLYGETGDSAARDAMVTTSTPDALARWGQSPGAAILTSCEAAQTPVARVKNWCWYVR